MAEVKLAEALLRRKELQQKVDQIRAIKDKDLFEVKARRQQVTENLEDVIAQVPRCRLADVTAEYDHYAKQLRLVDAAIQHANWDTTVTIQDSVMADYRDVAPWA